MKKYIMIIIVVIELFMALLTSLVFNSDNDNLLFSGGSIGSTMEVFSPNAIITSILFLATIISSFVYRKRVKPFLITFLVFFSLWFFNGRTIGVHWTGEVTTGWFNIGFAKITLHDEQNISNNIIEETSLESKFPFRVKFSNSYKEGIFFVGPVVKKDLIDYFNKSN
ncbi:hypothetical protein [uncultured Croceitalea sp.]|uniref:hypothetical protein n=1 Tax=uncultured Croceitalea sp. TaxID=1798908 RepID=UPI00330562E9